MRRLILPAKLRFSLIIHWAHRDFYATGGIKVAAPVRKSVSGLIERV